MKLVPASFAALLPLVSARRLTTTIVEAVAPTPLPLGSLAWSKSGGTSWATDGASDFTFYTHNKQHAISTDNATGINNAILMAVSGIEKVGRYALRFNFYPSEEDRWQYADGGWAIGLSDPFHLKAGYATEGLYFNGINLVSGGALLKGGYAKLDDPAPQSTETVDMFVQVSNSGSDKSNKLEVWFAHNGVSLGKAFDVPAGCGVDSSAAPLPLYPAISFHYVKMFATVEQVQFPQPELLVRADPTFGTLAGKWASQSLPVSEFVIRGACADKILDLDISAKVWNIIRTRVRCTAEEATESISSWTCAAQGSVISTMIMPPPEGVEKEKQVSEFLSSLKVPSHFRLENGGRLLIVGTMEFLRSADVFEPVRKPPFSCLTTVSQ